MNPIKKFLPFILSFGGILLDYLTTIMGLSLGFYETHPNYHPLLALLIFWSAIAILVLALPKEKPWKLSVNAIALISYLGAVNNMLVILGVFPGIRI